MTTKDDTAPYQDAPAVEAQPDDAEPFADRVPARFKRDGGRIAEHEDDA